MAEKENSRDSTKSDKVYKCQVCHIKCRDAEAYVEHLESKDHKKELMKDKYGVKYLEAKANLNKTPISTKLENKTTTWPKEETKLYQDNKGDDSSNGESSEEDVEVYTCSLCKKICTGFINYQMHLNGKKHQKAVRKDKLLKKMKDNNLLPKASKEKNPEEQSLLDMILIKAEYASQDIECEICQKKCTGPESYRQHCKSSAHLKKIAIKDLVDKLASEEGCQQPHGNGPPFARCEVCQKCFSGLVPYQQHMAGIQHLKQTKHVEELSKIKDLIIKDEEDPKKLHCVECGKSFSGPVPFNAHLQSTAHAKLKKRSSQMKSLIDNYPEFIKVPASIQDSEDSDDNGNRESFLLACDVCHQVFSGADAAKSHMESTKHKKVMKQKALFKKFLKKQAAMKGTEASSAQRKLKSAINSDSDEEFDIKENV